MMVYTLNIFGIFLSSIISQLSKNKKKAFCISVWFILSIIVGLRNIDTIQSQGLGDLYIYQRNYFSFSSYTFKELFVFNNAKAPAFYGLMYLFSKIGLSFQQFVAMISIFSIAVLMYYIYVYSDNPFLSVFVYLGMGGFVYSFYLLRQMIAISFILLAFDMYKKKKTLPMIALIIIAIMIHRYSIIVIALFFMERIKPKKYVIYFYIFFTIVFYVFRIQIARIMVIAFGDNYTGKYEVSGGIGGLAILYILFLIVFILLYYGRFLLDEYKEERFLLNGLIVLTIIQMCAAYSYTFTRLNYFFNIAIFTLALPKCISKEAIRRRFKSGSQLLYIPMFVSVVALLIYMYFSGIKAEMIDEYLFFWQA